MHMPNKKYLLFSRKDVDTERLFGYTRKRVRILLVVFEKPEISLPSLQNPALKPHP